MLLARLRDPVAGERLAAQRPDVLTEFDAALARISASGQAHRRLLPVQHVAELLTTAE